MEREESPSILSDALIQQPKNERVVFKIRLTICYKKARYKMCALCSTFSVEYFQLWNIYIEP